MEIVISLDENYLMPAGVLLTSLFENNKSHEVRIHALIGRGGGNFIESLSQITHQYKQNIFFYNVHDLLSQSISFPVDNKGQRENIPEESYYRLFFCFPD